MFIAIKHRNRSIYPLPTLVLVSVFVCSMVITVPRISNPGDIVYLDKGISILLGGHPRDIAIDPVRLSYNSHNIFVASTIGNNLHEDFIEK
ncbi:MAG: hypothetical protein QXM55_01780 [Ignisphaera sp.]